MFVAIWTSVALLILFIFNFLLFDIRFFSIFNLLIFEQCNRLNWSEQGSSEQNKKWNVIIALCCHRVFVCVRVCVRFMFVPLLDKTFNMVLNKATISSESSIVFMNFRFIFFIAFCYNNNHNNSCVYAMCNLPYVFTDFHMAYTLLIAWPHGSPVSSIVFLAWPLLKTKNTHTHTDVCIHWIEDIRYSLHIIQTPILWTKDQLIVCSILQCDHFSHFLVAFLFVNLAHCTMFEISSHSSRIL